MYDIQYYHQFTGKLKSTSKQESKDVGFATTEEELKPQEVTRSKSGN